MLFFIVVLLLAILAYGVTSRSMTAHKEFNFNLKEILQNVIYPQYFFIYGYIENELFTLEAMLRNTNHTNISSKSANESTIIAHYVLFAIHVLFVNILLVNLLIAMFK